MGGSLIEFEEFSRLSTEIDPRGPFPGTANVPHFAYLLRRCRALKLLADHDTAVNATAASRCLLV